MTTPVSVSRVKTYSICARRFYYKYVRGLEPMDGEASPRMLGLVVHHILAEVLKVYHMGNNAPRTEKVIQAAIKTALWNWDTENRPDFYGQFVDDAGVTVRQLNHERYEAWMAMCEKAEDMAYRTILELDIPNKYRVASDHDGNPLVEYELEHKWAATIHRHYLFRGRLDAVLESVDFGYNLLVDFKTTSSSFRSEEAEALDAQIGLYQYVLWATHKIHTPVGLLFQIKARSPEQPTTNQNGSMSRRKLTSTWEVYEDALLKEGLDPHDYEEEMRPKFAAIEWFRQTEVVRPEAVLRRMWDNFCEQVYRMDADTTYPRVFSPPTCKGCDFYKLCHAHLYGHDEEGIIEEEYTQQPAELQLFPIGIDTTKTQAQILGRQPGDPPDARISDQASLLGGML